MINFTKKYRKYFLYAKWNTIICDTSMKMAIFISNGAIYNFYLDLNKISFMHKMSNYKAKFTQITFTQINPELTSISK